MQFTTIPHLPNCRNYVESINLARAIRNGYLILLFQHVLLLIISFFFFLFSFNGVVFMFTVDM